MDLKILLPFRIFAEKTGVIRIVDEIARRTRQEVFAIARQALTDLAATSLEERLGEVFTRRLRELDSKVKEDLGHP